MLPRNCNVFVHGFVVSEKCRNAILIYSKRLCTTYDIVSANNIYPVLPHLYDPIINQSPALSKFVLYPPTFGETKQKSPKLVHLFKYPNASITSANLFLLCGCICTYFKIIIFCSFVSRVYALLC